MCAVRHTSLPTVKAIAENESLSFASPDSYLLSSTTSRPFVFPLDITLRNFVMEDAIVPPSASFTVPPACTLLDCIFDASPSDGGDGTITAYSWDFGDSSEPGTGISPRHDYATPGTYEVTLTVTATVGSGDALIELRDSITQSITVTGGGDNTGPTARFTFGCSDLVCTFDAGTSSNGEIGTIVSYDWDFGDEAVGSGVTTSHPYAAAGSYLVKLTVTDDQLLQSTFTQTVTPSAPVQTCTLTQTGTVPDKEYTLTITYDGGTANCPVQNNRGYSCTVANVLDGASYVVQGSREVLGTGPESGIVIRIDQIYDERVVNCEDNEGAQQQDYGAGDVIPGG